MLYLGAERLGKDSGVLCVFLQLKLMPIVSCFKMLIYISHSIRSSYTLKQGNRVIITYTSQNIKPLHRAVGSRMNPHCGGRFSNGILVHGNRRYSYSPTALGRETSQHDCEAKPGTFLAKTQTNIG